MFRSMVGLVVACSLAVACGDSGDGAGLTVSTGKNAVEAEVGKGGRVLELRSRARVTIPGGSLDEITTIRLEVGDLEELPPRPDEFEVIGEPLIVTPHGLRLKRPASIELAIDDEDTPQRDLRVLRLDDRKDRAWEELEDARVVEADEDSRFTRGLGVDRVSTDTVTSQRRLEVEVDGFSIFLPVRRMGEDCSARSEGSICRASAGDCDVAEVCDGRSADCPADEFASVGTQCRTSAGICDVAEVCTGSGADCPSDGVRAAESVCRPTRGACDVAEVCDGSRVACPDDAVAAAGTECSSAADACEMVATCDGTSLDCPVEDAGQCASAGDLARPLDPANPGSTFDSAANVALDGSGNALAIWTQYDGISATDVFSSYYDAAASTWGAPMLVETDPTGQAGFPQVAVNDRGDWMAVFIQSDGINHVWANRFDASSRTWGSAGSIEVTTGGNAAWPEVAVDPNGNAVAVWMKTSGTRQDIWANRYDAGAGTWATAELIESHDTGQSTVPDVVIDAAGNATAIWRQRGPTEHDIATNRYDAIGGTWGGDALIELDTGDTNYPRMAVDTNGNVIAVWTQFDGVRNVARASRYDVGGDTWGAVADIDVDNGGYAFNPEIDFDGSGNAVAVWNQRDGAAQTDVWVNRYNALAAAWGTAQLIETDNAGLAANAQVSVNSAGDAVVVWSQQDASSRYDVWSSRYSVGSGLWSGRALVESDDEGDAQYPEVALSEDGDAVAVWLREDALGAASQWVRWFGML